MKRGDIVTVALSGDYGKPRPAVVVQNDKVSLDSLILCLITSDVKTSQFRVFVEPSKETGLQKISQVMTDKIMTIPKSKIGKPCGFLSAEKMKEIEKSLLLVLGFTD